MKSAFHIYSERLEKILCKYMEHIEEGSHLDGYEMADLIREVSGNELDAEFVERYLKYVETGRGGKILKWDIKSPYDEETKMKITREGSENNPRFKMMEHGGIYQDIERMFGVKVAQMLRKYCELKNIDPYVVVNDTSVDRNGMCAWDKFDVWAKGKGVDFAAGFGNVDVDDLLGVGKPKTGKKKAKGHSARIYDRPTDSDIYGEESKTVEVDENDIAGWIAEDMQEWECVDDITPSKDSSNRFEVSTPDGDVYSVQVTKVFSSKLGSYLDER